MMSKKGLSFVHVMMFYPFAFGGVIFAADKRLFLLNIAFGNCYRGSKQQRLVLHETSLIIQLFFSLGNSLSWLMFLLFIAAIFWCLGTYEKVVPAFLQMIIYILNVFKHLKLYYKCLSILNCILTEGGGRRQQIQKAFN